MMENQEIQSYEVYAATMTLKAAVEELMLSGKEMIDATNQRGEAYLDSLKISQQALKDSLADIRDIETHQSISKETLRQIGNTKNEIVAVLNALKSIQTEVTDVQEKKFDSVNQNVINLTKTIEKNTNESVSTAINASLQELENKYIKSVSQYLSDAQKHMQQLDSQINESLAKVRRATDSLTGKMVAVAIGSGFVTAIFTSGIIKWFFIR